MMQDLTSSLVIAIIHPHISMQSQYVLSQVSCATEAREGK